MAKPPALLERQRRLELVDIPPARLLDEYFALLVNKAPIYVPVMKENGKPRLYCEEEIPGEAVCRMFVSKPTAAHYVSALNQMDKQELHDFVCWEAGVADVVGALKRLGKAYPQKKLTGMVVVNYLNQFFDLDILWTNDPKSVV